MNDEVTIRDLLEVQYPARLNSADIDGYVALYDDDVVWAVPNLPDATSPAQIGTLIGRILGKVTQTVDVSVDDVLIDGDHAIAMAVASGTATRKPDGEPQPLALRVMWALRRSDSGWTIIRQVGTPKPIA
jgi:ketosteroid isomerase-like protein